MMRYREILEERPRLDISDEERKVLLDFLINWLTGSFMHNKGREVPTTVYGHWNRLAALFPPRVNGPVTLMRLVVLPIDYAALKSFHLTKPAPGLVSSWSSVPFGIESVAGITSDDSDPETARIAIRAKIAPENILATPKSIQRAIKTLAHDYDYDTYHKDDGSFKKYLGTDDHRFHDELSAQLGYIWDKMPGGSMRQYEYVVRTTPVDATVARVFRTGEETHHYGHDDPHNSGSYRGWMNENLTEQGFATVRGKIVNVVENPSLRTLARLIASNEVMRGAILKDERFIVWPAAEAYHDQMTTMGQIEDRLVFYDSLEIMEMDCDWTMGSIYENDSIFYVASYGVDREVRNRYPALRNSINIGSFAGKGSDMPFGVNLRHDYRPD